MSFRAWLARLILSSEAVEDIERDKRAERDRLEEARQLRHEAEDALARYQLMESRANPRRGTDRR